MLIREVCKLCGAENPVGFDVPDDVWATVVPRSLGESVLCIMCFTAIADQKRVTWDKNIKLYPVSKITLETHE